MNLQLKKLYILLLKTIFVFSFKQTQSTGECQYFNVVCETDDGHHVCQSAGSPELSEVH